MTHATRGPVRFLDVADLRRARGRARRPPELGRLRRRRGLVDRVRSRAGRPDEAAAPPGRGRSGRGAATAVERPQPQHRVRRGTPDGRTPAARAAPRVLRAVRPPAVAGRASPAPAAPRAPPAPT